MKSTYILLIFGFFATSTLSFAMEIERIGSEISQSVPVKFTACLAGGGLNEGVEGLAWKHMIQNAPYGDLVVIHANRSSEDYTHWIYDNQEGASGFGHVNSVTEIMMTDPKDANDARVVQLIDEAEIIFFAGGDQSYYVDWFYGSEMLKVLQQRLTDQKVIVAGTSAGMALLGGIDYAAHFDSPTGVGAMVTAQDVLNNPDAQFVDLHPEVLVPPFLTQVVTESHFSQRDRQGRLVGFMAKAAKHAMSGTTAQTIRGLGLDENTVACYGKSGIARILGKGKATFLQGNADIESYSLGRPLHWEGHGQNALLTYIIDSKATDASFNLKSWTGTGGISERWWVTKDHAKATLRRKILHAKPLE